MVKPPPPRDPDAAQLQPLQIDGNPAVRMIGYATDGMLPNDIVALLQDAETGHATLRAVDLNDPQAAEKLGDLLATTAERVRSIVADVVSRQQAHERN